MTDEAIFMSREPLNLKCGSGLHSQRHEFSFPDACICVGCSITFPFLQSDPGLLSHLWKNTLVLVKVGEDGIVLRSLSHGASLGKVSCG